MKRLPPMSKHAPLACAIALLCAAGPALAQSATSSSESNAATVQHGAAARDASSTVVDAQADGPASDAVDASSNPAAMSPVVDTAANGADSTSSKPNQPSQSSSTSTDALVDASNPPAADASSDTPPAVDPNATPAESDFDALYGSGEPGDAGVPAAYDPWEPYNRRMHRFNNAVDRRVAKPLATAYVKVVPRPIRSGVSNFFSNLGQPVTAVNALLQGKPRAAAHSFGRFVVNSTLGIGGVFDPASDAKLDNRNEDFGQTLGVWGWKRSRYVELPLFGPRTLRDVVVMVGDAPLSPMRQIERDLVRAPLQGLQLVDLRMQLMSTDALREGAEDDYTLVRDAWMQRRAYQIDGDSADGVPEYLREDPTVVPVGAMPVSGG